MDQQQLQSHTEYASQLGELDHPGARDLLATETLTRLAYTGSDGFPRVVPIGFHWTGEHIVVCTVPSSPKVRAMAARPDIALTIDTDQGRPAGSCPCAAWPPSRSSTACRTSTSPPPPRRWTTSRAASSKRRCGRCMSRWPASPSSRAGRATTTSAPAGYPGFLAKLVQENQARQR